MESTEKIQNSIGEIESFDKISRQILEANREVSF